MWILSATAQRPDATEHLEYSLGAACVEHSPHDGALPACFESHLLYPVDEVDVGLFKGHPTGEEPRQGERQRAMQAMCTTWTQKLTIGQQSIMNASTALTLDGLTTMKTLEQDRQYNCGKLDRRNTVTVIAMWDHGDNEATGVSTLNGCCQLGLPAHTPPSPHHLRTRVVFCQQAALKP